MRYFSTFYITVFLAASIGTDKERVSAHKRDQNPCHCPKTECELHGSSFHHKVQVYKSTVQKDKLFCFAYQPIRWTLGSNSKQKPRVDPSELRLQSSSVRRGNGRKFCVSLRVRHQFPSWQAPTLFANCETIATRKVSSRWYKLGPKWEFDRQASKFNPRVTWIPKNPSDEAVKSTTKPSNNHRISVQPLNSTSQDSTAYHPHMVPLTTVVAAAAGAAAFLALLLILVVVLMRKVKRQRKEIEITNEEIDEFMLGVAAEKANAKGINALFILPYDTKLEIPKSDVIFRPKILGSGAFGQVITGTYQGRQVAIKMLKNKANSNAEYLKSLLGELKVMSYLGGHPNLVGLVGAITGDVKKAEAYLIFEFCSNGNAHKFVRDHRDNFVDMFTSQASSNISGFKRFSKMSKFYGTVHQDVGLTTKDLVRWSYEVALGMEFVASRNVYHGDLAARNILLTENLTAKVGDFGLSKQVDMETYNSYVQKKECPLPLKWMAIESLRDLTFSIQSDVWSFAVAMWELFTLGTVPYPGMDWNFESWKLLREGNRLDKPEYASDAIYDIMMSCWNADPKARPSFAKLKDVLHSELRKL